MPERYGGLFLPDDDNLMDQPPALPPIASPVEPTGEGLLIDSGFSSAYLVTDVERWQAILENPQLLIEDRPLDVQDLLQPLETAAHKAVPFVVIAPALTVRARALLIINKLRGIVYASAIETQLIGDVLAYTSRVPHVRRVTSGQRSSLVQ
ncbi:MAG: hypothetical protein QM831_09555 [Kofleriaceae bacterium]